MPAPKKPEGRRQAHHADRYKSLELAREPVPTPDPPKGLLKATLNLWEDFWASDVSRAWQTGDLDGLGRLIVYRDEWARLMNVYREARMVEGSTGQVKVNPALREALNLEAAMKSIAADLGLTPMARMRLGIAFGQATKTIEELRETANHDDDADDDPRLAALELPGPSS